MAQIYINLSIVPMDFACSWRDHSHNFDLAEVRVGRRFQRREPLIWRC
jgi:hypothetical protein